MKSTLEILINNKNINDRHKLSLEWFQKNKNEKFKGWLPKLNEKSGLVQRGDLKSANKYIKKKFF